MTEPVNYAACLTYGHPGKAWYMDGVEYSGIVWLDESPKPTKTSLEKLWPSIKYDLEVDSIRVERQKRYTVETDPMFYRVQRGEDGITLDDWKAAVDQIRADLPYPEPPAA